MLLPSGRFDRAAVMSRAHGLYRAARSRGDNRGFGYWLSYSWRVARGQREAVIRLAKKGEGMHRLGLVAMW